MASNAVSAPHSQVVQRYSVTAMWFHWTIAALVIANLAIGLLHESVPALKSWMPTHKAIGLTVLALTAFRIAWRLTHPAPPLPPATHAWERVSAHATHWTLYALLILMPLSGWSMVSGGTRRPLTWFGLFDLPYLPVSDAAAGVAHSIHGILGWIMLALVGLHIAAAMRHWLVLRDHVFGRMAPLLDRK